MRMKSAIALVAPLVLMVACGGSKDAAQKFDGPVVPWSSAQPAQLAERSPASTQCRAADLAIQGDVTFAPYGNGGGIAVVALQNKGKQACRLEGGPRVQFVKPGGPKQGKPGLGRPAVILPGPRFPVLGAPRNRPGEFAGLT